MRKQISNGKAIFLKFLEGAKYPEIELSQEFKYPDTNEVEKSELQRRNSKFKKAKETKRHEKLKINQFTYYK